MIRVTKNMFQHGQLRAPWNEDIDRIVFSSYLESIAKRLDYLLELTSVSKTTLSRRSGVSRSTLYRYLDAQEEPRLSTVVNVGLALGVKTFDLIYDKVFVVPEDYALESTIETCTYDNYGDNIPIRRFGADVRTAQPLEKITLDTFRLGVANGIERARRDGYAYQQYLATAALMPRHDMNRYVNNWSLPRITRIVNTCYALGETISDVVPTDRFVVPNRHVIVKEDLTNGT